MKKTFIVEIEEGEISREQYSAIEIEMYLEHGAESFVGNVLKNRMQIKVSDYPPKPLSENQLQRAIRRDVIVHHTEDKGFHCMEDERALDYLEIAKTNFPNGFKGLMTYPREKELDREIKKQSKRLGN